MLTRHITQTHVVMLNVYGLKIEFKSFVVCFLNVYCVKVRLHLYGWQVQGPLDVLKKTCTKPNASSEERSIVQFILDMRERLETHREQAKVNLQEAQTAQKRAFNTLRNNMCSVSVLQSPDFNHQFLVQVDASDKVKLRCLWCS